MNRKSGIPFSIFWAALVAVPLLGQSARLPLNLDHLAKNAVESVNVNLDASLLQLALKFLGHASGDPDIVRLKKLVGGLQGIYVRSFEFDKEGAYSAGDVDPLRKQLAGPGWSCLVSVRSKKSGGSDSDVCLRQESGKVLGLAILSTEPKKLTVVNIVGSISLDQLSDLEGQFGVPKLDLDKKSKPPKNKDEEE